MFKNLKIGQVVIASPKVLVLDDEKGIRDLMVRLFKKLGFECVTTSTISEARRHLNNVSFAFLDTTPDNGHVELAKELLAKGVSVYLFSGNNRIPANEKCVWMGLLEKPFELSDLAKILNISNYAA